MQETTKNILGYVMWATYNGSMHILKNDSQYCCHVTTMYAQTYNTQIHTGQSLNEIIPIY